MKKLFTLFALVLMLAVIIAMPTTASASGSCQLPGGSASAFCAMETGGYGSEYYWGCYESICWGIQQETNPCCN
jgi:hypothetical protein